MVILRADAPEYYACVGFPCSTTIITYSFPGLPPFSTVHVHPPLTLSLPLSLPLPLPSFAPPTPHLLPYVEEPEEVVEKTVSDARSRKKTMKGGEHGFGRKIVCKQGYGLGKKKNTSGTHLWKPKEEAGVTEEKTQTSQVVKIEKPKVLVEEPITRNGKKTTVMIKNIPNKYTRKMLLEFLDEHCMEENIKLSGSKEKPSAYDFVYLPIDFKTECNKGYAFVNFTEAIASWRFHNAKNNHRWGILQSKKICEISYARIQGKEALKTQFEQTSFMCDKEDYLPVHFEPYRDGPGKLVTQFTVGRCTSSSSSTPRSW